MQQITSKIPTQQTFDEKSSNNRAYLQIHRDRFCHRDFAMICDHHAFDHGLCHDLDDLCLDHDAFRDRDPDHDHDLYRDLEACPDPDHFGRDLDRDRGHDRDHDRAYPCDL